MTRNEFITSVETAKVIGIAGHVRPDGDCVGSCLGVYNFLKEGFPEKEVHVFLEPIPNIFKFLQNADALEDATKCSTHFDLFIALDCGDSSRLGAAAELFLAADHTFCIDHHLSNASFAEKNYIFPKASSTCELVYELLPKERIDLAIAECLYTGMVHDTGVFQYSCTSAKTMNIAGELMEKGIDYSRIIDETFYTKTYNQNRILGQALIDAKLYLGGKVIASVVTKDMMEQYDVLPKHLDGIVNQLRVTKDVEIALFLYQTDGESFKVSARASSDFNLAELAALYGGGGHAKAAGFTMEGTPEEILEKVVQEIERRM